MICIVLPVLNEASNIVPLLERIHGAVESMRYVVCLIDDGSVDNTVGLAVDAALRLGAPLHVIQRVKRHAGSQRGTALVAGLKWALDNTDASVIIEMDGDLSHRPEELPLGVEPVMVGAYDVVIGSKYVRGAAVINRPVVRRVVSLLCNFVVRRLITDRIHDYSNGYRFYSRHAAEAIRGTKIRYGSPIYLTEALSIWLARNLRITEFPTTYIGRGEGESKLRIVDLLKAAIAVFEISLRLHVRGFDAAHVEPQAEIAAAKERSIV